MSRTRNAALLAGLLYLSTHVTSVAAVVGYGSALTDPLSVLASTGDGPVLAGVLLESLLALGVLGTGVTLLPVLRPYAPVGAYAFSALRTMEAAVIAVGAVPMLALVALRDGRPGGAPAGGQMLAEGLVAVHQAAFLVGQGLVISVTTLVIAGTLWRTRLVPAWIGALGLVGGVLVLISNAAQLFGALDRGGTAALLALPVFAFEISFALYLVLRGVREIRPVAMPVFASTVAA